SEIGLTCANHTRVAKHAKSTAVGVAPRPGSMLKPPQAGETPGSWLPHLSVITLTSPTLFASNSIQREWEVVGISKQGPSRLQLSPCPDWWSQSESNRRPLQCHCSGASVSVVVARFLLLRRY